jgi:hypothetical protein
MNDEFKNKVEKILIQEYQKHVTSLFRNGDRKNWTSRMKSMGIKIFQETPAEPENIVIHTGLLLGWVHIPEDVAEKILVLGGLP